MLVLHIASVGSWFGIDVVMAVLTFTALGTDSESTKALCFRVLELVTVWPMTVSGLVCLVTGVLLAVGSKYGLTKYWWVVVKLFLNLLLSALVLVSLRPGVAEIADRAEAGDLGIPLGDMIYPPIVSPTLLTFAIVLSVFKPWGLLRRRKRTENAQGPAW
ncbi:membrane protein [Kribbella swartbergensis]